jgi:hypothetical protein
LIPSGWLTLTSLGAMRTKCPVVNTRLVSRVRGDEAAAEGLIHTMLLVQCYELEVLVPNEDATNVPPSAEGRDKRAGNIGQR